MSSGVILSVYLLSFSHFGQFSIVNVCADEPLLQNGISTLSSEPYFMV